MKITALEIMNVGDDVDLSEYKNLGDFTSYDITRVEEIGDRAEDKQASDQ